MASSLTLRGVLPGALALTLAASSWAQTPAPIVQPGAPGQPSKTLAAEDAVQIADTAYTVDDVRFLTDMIPHHHQALVMSRWAPERTNNQEILDLAGRIDSTQADEIAFMQDWLRERGEPVPDPTAHHAMHAHHDMAGMATPAQMEALEASRGTAFDRLFLQLMIPHHDGALTMAEELLEQPGAAFDATLFDFTSDVQNDQAVEIERMNALLVALSEDPRANLRSGLRDAEQALMNMELLAALPKPAGFFDPDNPGERGSLPLEDEADTDGDAMDETPRLLGDNSDRRYPMLSFSNTDMAFRDDVLVAGSYHGFNVYQLQDGMPELMASIVCPGGQGDVSIVGDLLIMSVEQTRGRLDCGLEGVSEDVSPERFRGLRIFDISDLKNPIQVGAVQTCRGSHTHSVVSGPDADGKIVVFNSGTSIVRENEELASCFDEVPGDDRTALFRIDVIEIPVDNPSAARIVDSPAVFADDETGALAGLWRGGDHGDDTQETYVTDQCHDITVFPSGAIAAGACSGNGIIFDISNPREPKRIDVVTDTGFAYWHSATFNNDGTKVLFTDEWGGGSRPRCRAWDPLNWGANAIYDIVDGKLEFRSHYKMPAPQLETENCVAHNGSIVPVPGRDIFVQAWYQGGISVMDFTDSANPVEIAYFDRGPLFDDELVVGGFWSVYYYEGAIYGTEIVRGLDVLRLTPSEYLSANEIAAAALAQQPGAVGRLFNPQQQFPVSWPAEPVVARAYLDQLQRAGALSEEARSNWDEALGRVDSAFAAGEADPALASELETLAAGLAGTGALAATLSELAARLRG
ncbi:MAG: DUF305 domain-containing protein [Xanthomonadales bacterium]|nr:DUF305 domain-containing protein [Xanthomonadales bacterium]